MICLYILDTIFMFIDDWTRVISYLYPALISSILLRLIFPSFIVYIGEVFLMGRMLYVALPVELIISIRAFFIRP